MINGGGAGTGDVLVQVVALGGVHTFSPSFLVDGTMAVSRDPLTLIGPDSGSAFGLDTLHIPGHQRTRRRDTTASRSSPSAGTSRSATAKRICRSTSAAPISLTR